VRRSVGALPYRGGANGLADVLLSATRAREAAERCGSLCLLIIDSVAPLGCGLRRDACAREGRGAMLMPRLTITSAGVDWWFQAGGGAPMAAEICVAVCTGRRRIDGSTLRYSAERTALERLLAQVCGAC
jgi:hypothetical protein